MKEYNSYEIGEKYFIVINFDCEGGAGKILFSVNTILDRSRVSSPLFVMLDPHKCEIDGKELSNDFSELRLVNYYNVAVKNKFTAPANLWAYANSFKITFLNDYILFGLNISLNDDKLSIRNIMSRFSSDDLFSFNSFEEGELFYETL